MKVLVTFYDEHTKSGNCYSMIRFPSLTAAAAHCKRDRRILGYKMRHGGPDIKTNLGTIISIEAIDGKTNGATGTLREYPDKPEENFPLGSLEIFGGRGWIQQAMGKITAAIKWCLSKFN